MHSIIFQVSMDPIKKCDYITESDYWDHWFTREIADYVSDSKRRTTDIDLLVLCKKGINVSADTYGEFLIITDREKYFQTAFDSFKKAVENIKDFTITEFINASSYDIWKVSNAYEDKHGFYINADGELITLDEFVRSCALNEKYYIGGTLYYHC